MLYEVNLKLRDYFTYTDAMLNNSLFSEFLKTHGMYVHKGDSTRDIICLDFDFGSRSCEEEKKRLQKLLEKTDDESSRERIKEAIKKADENEHLFSPKKREEIRKEYYENGVDITYKTLDKNGNVKKEQTIHYVMLFRTSAKAKLGQVIFINKKLYKKAYDWLTIGLGKKMTGDNAKIVEMSAYAPLTTSNIIDSLQIPVKDILILKDQDSFFETMANVVKAEEYTDKKGKTRKKCVVHREKTKVKNTLWDGMGLIDIDILPDWINGMALLRNHLFKMCGFKTNMKLFFRDWCEKNGFDYDTYQVQDMFGNWHFLKDIKVITTDNSIKWKKFIDLMGGTPEAAYEYWCNRIEADNNTWGIVKTDHPSKLGEYQQLSYQMINTLPCTRNDVRDIASVSIQYVETLKNDNDEFERFLRKYANEVNHYEMLADLYEHNNDFANSTYFRHEKAEIIKQYVYRMRKGKIMVAGDNLTVCGNPYGLLLYAVGSDWENDTTLKPEDGAIQCYTTRFSAGEYLAGFRNPHNSPNNICYFHNVYSYEMNRYFAFSDNIMAVNCIQTDVQDRMNGMDFDSDFNLITNQRTIVKYAAICYREFPTIVNALQESGITYKNTKAEYANMDNKFSKSRMGIGYSSNLAQLALTYYWTGLQNQFPDEKKQRELYDNFVILSVLAQVIIDGCKREYEIDGMEEINRISKMPCMTLTKKIFDNKGNSKIIKYDFPEFMKYTREIKYTKNGKELSHEKIAEAKHKLKQRINPIFSCPMNWLEEWIDKIQGASTAETIPTENYFIKMSGKANDRQMTKFMEIVIDYDSFIKQLCLISFDDDELYLTELLNKTKEVLYELSKIKSRIKNIVTINRLIELSLGISNEKGLSIRRKYTPSKHTRKILNLLYKMDKQRFLDNFC